MSLTWTHENLLLSKCTEWQQAYSCQFSLSLLFTHSHSPIPQYLGSASPHSHHWASTPQTLTLPLIFYPRRLKDFQTFPSPLWFWNSKTHTKEFQSPTPNTTQVSLFPCHYHLQLLNPSWKCGFVQEKFIHLFILHISKYFHEFQSIFDNLFFSISYVPTSIFNNQMV